MKYLVTRKRMVQQEATLEVTVTEGEMPIDAAVKIAESKWKWVNTSATDLSTDVAPVKTDA